MDPEALNYEPDLEIHLESTCLYPTPVPPTTPPTVPPVVPPVPPTTPPGPPVPPPSTPPITVVDPPAAPAPACTVGYELIIVNPDGSRRRSGEPTHARIERTGQGSDLVRFEDGGGDTDHNDVVIRVDTTDCTRLLLTLASVDAAWHHAVRLAIIQGGVRGKETLVWADSHRGVGKEARFDAASPTGAQACKLEVPFTRTLIHGNEGADVVRLQDLLRCLGHFSAARSTGYYGNATQRAVEAFQKANGIEAAGIVGPRTRNALNTHAR